MIIKTDQGHFIKVEEFMVDTLNESICWGYRWNKNEEKFSYQCIKYYFGGYILVTEADLPKRLPEVEV